MNMKKFGYTLISLIFVFLTACSTTSSNDPSEAYKGQSADQIFNAGEGALRSRNYGEAIKRFEALDVQYPMGRNAEIAALHIIYAYYMNSDYLSSEAAADRFIHSYPANPHVDYAYFMRGLANYYQNMGLFERLFTVDFATRDLTQIKKSYTDFSDLTQQFPNSRYAPAAHQYMIYLRNVLANHQLQVAQFYYTRKAYIAALDRAGIVVKHYQSSSAVPEALVMMAKCYHQLHLTRSENEVIEVLQYNYPNSIYVAIAKDKNPSPKVPPIANK